MSLALIREYINLVDENGDNKGFVLPCDLFKHMSAKGMEPRKAALMAGIVSLAAGLSTNPSLPLYAKTDGPDREHVVIPRDLDTADILRQGGKGLFQQALAIAEALLVPELAAGLERKFVPKKMRAKVAKGVEVGELRKLKHKKGLFKIVDGLLANKGLLKMIGGAGTASTLLQKFAPLLQQVMGAGK